MAGCVGCLLKWQATFFLVHTSNFVQFLFFLRLGSFIFPGLFVFQKRIMSLLSELFAVNLVWGIVFMSFMFLGGNHSHFLNFF